MNRKTGFEHFIYNNNPLEYQLSEFWSWFASDLTNNTLRGALAEFIVAKALGIEIAFPREDWSAYDLLFLNHKIEVKASGYIQSWSDTPSSSVRFSLRPTRSWDAQQGYDAIARRQSDIYVFCIHAETGKSKADPLNLEQWAFYPVLTAVLNNRLGVQKTASLRTIEQLCTAQCDYGALRTNILTLISDNIQL